METLGVAGKLDFRGRKRGVDAEGGKAHKQAGVVATLAQAPAAAPAAKKRRAAKQPTMKQALSAALAASGAAQARGGDGITATQLSRKAAEREGAEVDAARAQPGAVGAAERLPAAAEAPGTQPQDAEPHTAPTAAPASASAAPLAAAHAAAAPGPVVFEHEVRPAARCAAPRGLCAALWPLPPLC